MSGSAQRIRKVAKSYQQPRTLDAFKEHFGKSDGNREGFLEVSIVSRNESPNGTLWEKRYVVLEDGMLYSRLEEDDELEEMVALDSISSVKTTKSLENQTIIALITADRGYYLHSPVRSPSGDSIEDSIEESEEDMKEWLFKLHRSVMDYLVGSDGATAVIPGTLLSRQVIAGRSHSGDQQKGSQSRAWSASVDFDGNELVGRKPMRGLSHHSMSASPATTTSSSPINVRTVEDVGEEEFMMHHFESEESDEEGTELYRLRTRDFGARPFSKDGGAFGKKFSVTSSESESSSPRVAPSMLDSVEPSLPLPTPSKSPSIHEFGRRSPGSYREASRSITTESTKRVKDPPVELSSPHSAGSPTLGNRKFSKPTTESVPIPAPSIGSPTATAAPKPAKGKYIPPHLRNKQQEQTGGESGGIISSLGRSLESVLLRDDENGEDRFEDEGLFSMESSSRSVLGHKGNDNTFPDPDMVESSCLYGRKAAQGCRSTMEDFDIAIQNVEGGQIGYYGVFDGHCGTRAAELACEKLHKYAIEAPGNRFFSDWPKGPIESLEQSFKRVERDFFEESEKSETPLQDGSCALVVLVHYPSKDTCVADSITVGNLGDSRAVLYHNGKTVPLCKEHSPNRPDERERIESIGGWVTVEKEMVLDRLHRMELHDPLVREKARKQIDYVEISRINGELAVSRALGDIDYKKPAQDNYSWFFPPNHPAYKKQSYKFGGDLVDPTPEWETHDLEPVDPDTPYRSFVIVACDGLWEAVSNEDAVNICLESKSPQHACNKLVTHALRMGTSDNTTVQVVALSPESFEHCAKNYRP
mmetsp:Transcript_17872/g.28977  ORF Transcript_17872/g.28977 Transcript_17872/m.28977 type:complete len:814 (-) Transcript_17872:68-2509(-)|eukprot:CAMPEP_0203757940 /NCGR_PEP_ID=MMETSP0098-20131031/10768_1 /ASSEMBLY_ACC=CAM_ASM_000208 /TAXON_ID=96639 /ORGANISM=" , Strain NY0313808BC1" /LENGTH=813 /DNA_ID=CAMNT_0050650185 /DNA_START=106 /DNA_END=2547 /DNA_ORIENTATION=+